MIEIKDKNGTLLLEYTPEKPPYDWVQKELDESNSVTLSKTFHFSNDDILKEPLNDTNNFDFDTEGSSTTFVLAESENGYYKVKSHILGIQADALLSKDMQINKKTFVAHRDISIFSKIDKLIEEPIVVGGNHENAVPEADFKKLLKNFPTTTELTHYAHSRIFLILKEYLGTMTDAQKKLSIYLEKKTPIKPSTKVPALYEYEVHKYEYIRDRIKEMLADADAYSENEWQALMLEFILLIFPKYVAVLEKVNIKDFYSKAASVTERFIDLALVDANGNLDVIEIKKPFESCLISTGKYRDNYTPKKELSGTIMQAEKYLFHLNKWGVSGEKKITEKYKADLPDGIKIKITNPKAVIIVGRNTKLSAEQSFDFEIMKRKYANILDVITYDDLLNRLENIIVKFRNKQSKTAHY
jgi:hypothetical protein